MIKYWWIVAIILMAGCAGAGSKVLTEDKMTSVLWDMIQVDELATLRLARDTGKNIKTEHIRLYQKVFQLHQVSEEQFSKSLSYYSSHPDLFKLLFDTLEARGVKERKLIKLAIEPVAK